MQSKELGKVGYEAMIRRINPNGVHRWEDQPQSVRDDWNAVATAIVVHAVAECEPSTDSAAPTRLAMVKSSRTRSGQAEQK